MPHRQWTLTYASVVPLDQARRSLEFGYQLVPGHRSVTSYTRNAGSDGSITCIPGAITISVFAHSEAFIQ
jgi:hypothetical protein